MEKYGKIKAEKVVMLITVKNREIDLYIFLNFGVWSFCTIIKYHAHLQNPKVWK